MSAFHVKQRCKVSNNHYELCIFKAGKLHIKWGDWHVCIRSSNGCWIYLSWIQRCQVFLFLWPHDQLDTFWEEHCHHPSKFFQEMQQSFQRSLERLPWNKRDVKNCNAIEHWELKKSTLSSKPCVISVGLVRCSEPSNCRKSCSCLKLGAKPATEPDQHEASRHSQQLHSIAWRRQLLQQACG